MSAQARELAIICDVDGTLCDVRSVRHFVERPKGAQKFRANFAAFHSASEACPAFPQVVQLITSLALENYVIVIVTAREARWAGLTQRWLDEHGVPGVELITRRDLDYRPDAVVKAEMSADICARYEPRLAIDDRDAVLAVWAAASIPTVKVGETGIVSGITWPCRAQDYKLMSIVDKVRGLTAPPA